MLTRTKVSIAAGFAVLCFASYLGFRPAKPHQGANIGVAVPTQLPLRVSTEPALAPARPPSPMASAIAIAATPASISYESAKDIWQFASDALASGNSARLYEGYQAARECRQMFLIDTGLLNFAAGGSPGPYGEITAERQQAISALASKCQGFLQHGRPASDALVKELQVAGEATGGTEFSKHPDPKSSEAGVETFARLQSPAARGVEIWSQLDPLAMTLMQREGDSVSPDNRDAVKTQALMQALCQLGKNCSSTSMTLLYVCASANQCDGVQPVNADAATVGRIAAGVVAAVRQAEK